MIDEKKCNSEADFHLERIKKIAEQTKAPEKPIRDWYIKKILLAK